MFGESSSESQRVTSPWDSLISAPSSPPKHNGIRDIPKLVPEVEEGNVEYKLQLLSPSLTRFVRLVTQLKWRLLEGGGKAFYELGVADSGALVGLPRQQLEESLETLEMMAGEIGASVIVVKEIEVPPELSSLAESTLERWEGRMSTRRKNLSRTTKGDASPVFPIEFGTELSSTDITDTEESVCHSPTTPLTPPCDPVQFKPPLTHIPFDPALAILTTDLADCADNEALNNHGSTDFLTEFSLKILSVHKPRPMKKRATHFTSPPSAHFEHVKTRPKNSYPLIGSTGTTCHTGDSIARDSFGTLSQPRAAKVQLRRDKRDKRRELKHIALATHVTTCLSTESPINSAGHHTKPLCLTDKPISSVPESLRVNIVDSPAGDTSGTSAITSNEPRLIVEALVVWELPSDETFLDFEGFLLQ